MIRILACLVVLVPSLAFAAGPRPRLRIGDALPDVVLPDAKGKPLRLRSLGGQILAISFYSRYCRSCQRELPALERVVEQVRRGSKVPLQLLAIAVDGSPPAALAARLGARLRWLFDRHGAARRAFDPQRYPCTFLVTGTGRVRHINRGFGPGFERRVARWLERMVAAAPAPH